MADAPKDIDDYIATAPADSQPALREIRTRIHALVPDATEAISYQIPTFKLDGKVLVHFAGWKEHVSIYPAPEPDEALDADLAPYQDAKSKGTLKFPLDEPMPYDLIGRVIAKLAEVNRPAGS